MSNCAQRFQDLVHERDVVLDEDVAALKRTSEQERIERYNSIKADEAQFRETFTGDCREFLTPSERDRVRGQFRLARLLIAASFYDEGALPPAMADDFAEPALEAVVDFERFKRFDALSPEQIEEHVRRMDGEVYELVTEYTATQLATVEDLLENPDVQQDLVERLLARYEERREKIRQGFFTYVETHGLEHMVEAIEEAVRAVADAAEERERIRETRQQATADVSVRVDGRLQHRGRQLESELGAAESATDVERIRERASDVTEAQATAVAELDDRIDETADLETRIEAKIEDLEQARDAASDVAREQAREEATELVENELENLRAEREAVREEVEQLKRERERLETARDRLTERQEELAARVDDIEQSVDTADGNLDGDEVVTAEVARLLELDYLGRFDISMGETEGIDTGDHYFEVPDGYWESRSERRNERMRLVDLLDDASALDQYPANRSARYEITDDQYFGLARETEMVIEARVCAHLPAYATNGFDAAPADLDDLLELVNEAVYEAEQDDCTYLLGVASPTGWTDRVVEQLRDDGVARTRFSQHVSVCLVDLGDGSLLYDESDPVVAENASLFEPPVAAERVEDCMGTIRTEYVEDIGTETVLLRDVVDAHGYDSHIVKQAFDRLAADGAGEQFFVEDLGLTLEVGT